MTARLQLRLVDRDGNGRTTRVSVARPLLLSELIAKIQEFETAVSGISTARVQSGTIVLARPPTAGTAGPQSNVGRTGLLITNQDTDYSSISIPSIRLDLPYDASGIYEDIRIRQANPGAAAAFADLLAVLDGSANPDGTPFVIGPWVAGRMLNR